MRRGNLPLSLRIFTKRRRATILHPRVRLKFSSAMTRIIFTWRFMPSMSRISACHRAERDAIFADDNVRLFLDTYNDKRRAYALSFNPLGVQTTDAIYTEGSGFDYSIDIVMESKGAITSDGFVVEVAIPFKSLRYEAGKDKVWGLHAFRAIKRFNNELTSWMPLPRDQSGLLNKEGHITGLEGLFDRAHTGNCPHPDALRNGRRVRAIPRAVASNNGLLDPGRIVNPPLEFDPGLSVKYGITPSVTLDLTLNPDFAQVEADHTVVTANQRFPIFFAEKRPFFLEGIDVFQTPLTAVHTRSIIDPDYAVSLTGKRGRNSFGLLLANDNGPGDFSVDERTDPEALPRIERFLDKNAYVGVLRLKRDIGLESNIGSIATTYHFIEKHNNLGGFDGRFRVNPQTTFTFQALGTTSRRFFRDADLGRNVYRTGNAFGYFWRWERTGRNWSYEFNGEGRTRDYRADVGFTRRTNTNRKLFTASYNSDPQPHAKLISWNAGQTTFTNFDWQGRMQNWETETRAGINLRRQTSLGVGFMTGYERVFEEEFGAKRTLTRAGRFAGDDAERSTI